MCLQSLLLACNSGTCLKYLTLWCPQSMIFIISRRLEDDIPFRQKMASSQIFTPLCCSPQPFGVPGPEAVGLISFVQHVGVWHSTSLHEHPNTGFQAVLNPFWNPGCLSSGFFVAGPCLGIFIIVLWQKLWQVALCLQHNGLLYNNGLNSCFFSSNIFCELMGSLTVSLTTSVLILGITGLLRFYQLKPAQSQCSAASAELACAPGRIFLWDDLKWIRGLPHNFPVTRLVSCTVCMFDFILIFPIMTTGALVYNANKILLELFSLWRGWEKK